MIVIYHTENQFKNNNNFNQLLKLLPEKMHARALRYKFKQDAYNYVVGRLLLKTGLQKLNLGNEINHLKCNKNGKPTLPQVFFNISHSLQNVVCAVSLKVSMGIDIEIHQTIDLNNFQKFFTDKEWQNIHNANNPKTRFYWYWTRKESIIKALGKNLNYLHQIEIDVSQDFFYDGKKKWYLYNLDIEKNCSSAICCDENVGFNLVDVKVDDFIF